MATNAAASRWKSLLRKHRQDENVEDRPAKQHVTTRPTSHSAQPRRTSLADTYCKTQKTLGEDDCRDVFVAVRKDNNRCVAVKRFERRDSSEPRASFDKKVQAEFWIGSQLQHENIIENVDLIHEDSGNWFQVMEYAPFNLFDRVGSMRMSPDEIDCAFAQVAAGVHYLHKAGFAHRDLKLENVVYTNSGVMKIIDFGVATICKRSDGQRRQLCNDYVGCRPYMSPEIIYRKQYDPQSADVWSLAVMYCCMVMKRFPWKEASHKDLKFAEFIRYLTVADRAQRDQRKSEPRSQHGPVTDLSVSGHKSRVFGGDASKDSAICVVVEIVSETEKAKTINKVAPSPLSQNFSDESWAVIKEMLHVDFERRLTMKQLVNTPWMRHTRTCSQLESQQDRDSCTHKHT